MARTKQLKSPMARYTRKDFDRDFPDDAACLDWLARHLYPSFPGVECKSAQCAGKVRKHHRIAERPAYACDECGHHVYPMAGTVYEKSTTPLRTWFLAVFLMSTTRTGFPAKWLERQIGVTYKTAWRILRQFRAMLYEGPPTLTGKVEVDETYFGGYRRGQRGPTGPNKSIVLGLVERGGRAYAEVIPNARKSTVVPMVEKHVEPGATIYTDELRSYATLPARGYAHETVRHWDKTWVIGDAHTNTMEGFWGNMKRGIDGAHHRVSKQYLPNYVDEWTFRYSHRLDVTPMFWTMLRQVSA